MNVFVRRPVYMAADRFVNSPLRLGILSYGAGYSWSWGEAVVGPDSFKARCFRAFIPRWSHVAAIANTTFKTLRPATVDATPESSRSP